MYFFKFVFHLVIVLLVTWCRRSTTQLFVPRADVHKYENSVKTHVSTLRASYVPCSPSADEKSYFPTLAQVIFLSVALTFLIF